MQSYKKYEHIYAHIGHVFFFEFTVSKNYKDMLVRIQSEDEY